MGKKSREKAERRELIAQGKLEPTEEESKDIAKSKERETKKEQEKEIKKYTILANLKLNWKPNVKYQYKEDPDKVKNTNIEKNTDDICNNFQVKMIMKSQGLVREDIKRILTEIRDEVIAEGEIK